MGKKMLIPSKKIFLQMYFSNILSKFEWIGFSFFSFGEHFFLQKTVIVVSWKAVSSEIVILSKIKKK